MGESPRLPPLHSQSLRDRMTWQLRELSEPTQPQPLELRVAVGRHGKQREREWLEESLLVLIRHDQDLTRARDACRGESGKAATGGANAWIPGRADRCDRALERRLHTSVEPLDPSRLEDDSALLDRIDGETCIFESPQDPFPLPLDDSRIAVDEYKRRARGKRLPQSHPRPHAGCFRSACNRAEERFLAFLRSERRRDERQPRPRAQCRSQLEPWNEEARDHGEHMFYTNIRSPVKLAHATNLGAVTNARQADDDRFVVFGPEQARKARQEANLPDPPISPLPPIPDDVHPIVRIILRAWRSMTLGTEEIRKLWSTDAVTRKEARLVVVPRLGSRARGGFRACRCGAR